MQISMDEERWSVDDNARVAETVAAISDRAHAKGRLVTRLSIAGRSISDRDLIPPLLERRVGEIGPIHAQTQSLEDITRRAEATVHQYVSLLRADGESLVSGLRTHTASVSSVDSWLGRLADYLEYADKAMPGSTGQEGGLYSWAHKLVHARTSGDSIMVADLLEYEILPRLLP